MTNPATTAPRPGALAITPRTRLIAFIAAVTLARLIFAAAIPLTEDEAYYRLWAASPQFGYYDHPPMIAWWIHAGMRLAGDTPLGVRLLPSLASGVTGLLVFDLALRLGAEAATAARAGVWYNATLLIALGGALATPDAAATPFWAATLCCLARTGNPRDAGWWLAAGGAAGLACLSKYSALFLAPGVLVWLAITPGGLARLRRPWPWAAALLAIAVFSPNLVWNAQHHWESFGKQFGRLVPHGLKPEHLVELVFGQALLLNPLIAVFVVRGLRASWRRRAEPGGFDPRLLIGASLPFAAYLVLHSLHDRVQAHWPAPLYPALAVIAAVAANQASPGGWLIALRRSATPVGLGLAALVLGHLALPASDIRGLADPSAAVRGWPAFARTVGRLRQTHGAAWIGALSYGETAQLAAAGAPGPVLQITERDRYPPGDPSWRADVGRPGLVVDIDRRVSLALLSACFARVTPLGELARGEGDLAGEHYGAFLVAQPRGDLLRRGCALRRPPA